VTGIVIVVALIATFMVAGFLPAIAILAVTFDVLVTA